MINRLLVWLGMGHWYLSTSCLHGNHWYCRSATNLAAGAKNPASCKFCGTACRCRCHRSKGS